MLSRYNVLIFGIILFFQKNIKKFIINFGLFLGILLPWFIYNKYKWGNFFTSIIDSYSLNVVSRMNNFQQFKFIDLLISINFYLPFLIIGLFVFILLICKKINGKEVEAKTFYYNSIFLITFILIIYDYASTPFKISRYLFNLALPIAFFSTSGILYLFNKSKKQQKIIISVLTILFFLSLTILFIKTYQNRISDDKYFEAAQSIKKLGITDCVIRSPLWVPVNYYTNNVYGLYKINYTLESKGYVLIFPCCATIDDTFNMDEISSYPTLLKTNDFVILADFDTNNETCLKRSGWDDPMVSDQCALIKKQFGNFSGRICKIINK